MAGVQVDPVGLISIIDGVFAAYEAAHPGVDTRLRSMDQLSAPIDGPIPDAVVALLRMCRGALAACGEPGEGDRLRGTLRAIRDAASAELTDGDGEEGQ